MTAKPIDPGVTSGRNLSKVSTRAERGREGYVLQKSKKDVTTERIRHTYLQTYPQGLLRLEPTTKHAATQRSWQHLGSLL